MFIALAKRADKNNIDKTMKLNYKIIGNGEPIIILHGLFGMLDNWMSFANKLANDYAVILVDQRNHGKSGHSDEVGYYYFAQDLFDLLERLKISQAHIMGHSMGGKTAMIFSLTYPNKTKSLISIDMGAHGYYKSNHNAIFDAVLSIDLSQYSRRSQIDRQLEISISDLSTRQFILKNLQRENNGYSWKANFKALHKGYDELRVEINATTPYFGKTLFVKGELSDYIVKSDFEFIQKIFPNVEFQTIENAGHWIHAQKPNELLSVVRKFLE